MTTIRNFRLSPGAFRERNLPPGYRELSPCCGVQDLACINATDPTFRGCLFCLPRPVTVYPPRVRYLRRQRAAHLAVANHLERARRKLGRKATLATLQALLGNRPTES